MVKYPFHIGFSAPSRTIEDVSKYEAIERYLTDRGAKVTFDETVFHPVNNSVVQKTLVLPLLCGKSRIPRSMW
ncbi:MAG: hypothetical protein IKC44_01660 [Burkholderiaceae bacterium]|nr:hypothetical protein [Burkholderiaceae bacterium]